MYMVFGVCCWLEHLDQLACDCRSKYHYVKLPDISSVRKTRNDILELKDVQIHQIIKMSGKSGCQIVQKK